MSYVGKCSNCGGRVERDMEGDERCSGCGAMKSLPTIPMDLPRDDWPNGDYKRTNGGRDKGCLILEEDLRR